jgi:hypothetical protein
MPLSEKRKKKERRKKFENMKDIERKKYEKKETKKEKRNEKKKELQEKRKERFREQKKNLLASVRKTEPQPVKVVLDKTRGNTLMQTLRNLTRKYYNPTNFKIENTNEPIISRRTEKSNAAKLIQQRFRKNINNSLRFRKNINNSSMSAKSRKKKCLKELRDCDASNKIERGKSPISYYERKAKNNPKCGRLYNKCMGEKSGYEPDLDRPSYYGNSDYLSNSQ